jgi:hypothetical protein
METSSKRFLAFFASCLILEHPFPLVARAEPFLEAWHAPACRVARRATPRGRHLIADRLSVGGARRGLDRAEAAPTLRAVISNGDVKAYWAFHIRREHDRVHQARCQAGYDLIA